MTAPAALKHPDPRRVRASERAVTAALKALQNAGLTVDKLCVLGGQVEIHVGSVDGEPAEENHGGLKEW